jgi:hypothetical protein
MPLKILRASDPLEVTTLTCVLYAQPGIGKTTLSFTAEAPLLLDFDRGSYRAPNRKDITPIDTWADVASMTREDLAPFSTLIVDTAGRALDRLSEEIIATNPKASTSSGSLSLQGYGDLKARFTAWLRFVRSCGLNVILIAHTAEEKDGEETRERLDIQGSSKNEIYKSADLMGTLFIRNGQRVLSFDPTATRFGKNPGRLPELVVPRPDQEPLFLAGVLKTVLGELNNNAKRQKAAHDELAVWQGRIIGSEDLAGFNAFFNAAREVDGLKVPLRAMFLKAAKERGYVWNKAAEAFQAKAAA